MAYRFRLEAVRNVRERMLEAAKMELGASIAKSNRIQRELRLLEDHIAREQNRLSEEMKRGILAHEYRTKSQILVNLKTLLSKKEKELRKAEQEVLNKRRQLEAKYREKELIERLRERDYKEYLQEMARRFQAEVDDLVSMKHNPNQTAGGGVVR